MPVELDIAAILAGLIVLGILGSSAILWIVDLQDPHSKTRDHQVKPWPIGWTNFGIFLCAMVISVLIAQVFGGELLRLDGDTHSVSEPNEWANEPTYSDSSTTAETHSQGIHPALTPWTAVAAVLLLQLPLIAAFYGLRRCYPNQFAGRSNTYSLSPKQAFTVALPFFIRYLPIIWIVSFAWSSLLTYLQSQGIIDEFPPQALIQLFTEGGDPVAIIVLALLAVLLAPWVEETIFRGGIYRFLKSQTAVLPAQILSGAVFALIHGNLMSFAPLIVVGILLARVYERSGNLLVPICFHACFNGLSLIMLYVMSHASLPMS
jgi:membrane protease YdiL (CAAX protease family)